MHTVCALIKAVVLTYILFLLLQGYHLYFNGFNKKLLIIPIFQLIAITVIDVATMNYLTDSLVAINQLD